MCLITRPGILILDAVIWQVLSYCFVNVRVWSGSPGHFRLPYLAVVFWIVRIPIQYFGFHVPRPDVATRGRLAQLMLVPQSTATHHAGSTYIIRQDVQAAWSASLMRTSRSMFCHNC